jgi:hypothetical protein
MSWDVALIVAAPQILAALLSAWYSRRAHKAVTGEVAPRLEAVEHAINGGGS